MIDIEYDFRFFLQLFKFVLK